MSTARAHMRNLAFNTAVYWQGIYFFECSTLDRLMTFSL